MLFEKKEWIFLKNVLTFLDTRVDLDQSGFKFDIFEH